MTFDIFINWSVKSVAIFYSFNTYTYSKYVEQMIILKFKWDIH